MLLLLISSIEQKEGFQNKGLAVKKRLPIKAANQERIGHRVKLKIVGVTNVFLIWQDFLYCSFSNGLPVRPS